MLEEIFNDKQVIEQIVRDAKTYLGRYDEDWVRCCDMWDRTKKHDTRYVYLSGAKFFVTGLAIKENDLGGHDIVDVSREYSLSEVLTQFKDIMAKENIVIESEEYISDYIEKTEKAREFLIDVYGVISNMTDITKECTVDVEVDMGYFRQSYHTVFQMRRPRTEENGLVFDELNIKESLVIWCKHFGSVERITQPYDYCRKQIKRMSEYILPYKGGFEALFPDEERKAEYMEGLKKALREKK